MTGMLGLLEFVYENSREIKRMVREERAKLTVNNAGEEVSVQMEHVPNGKLLNLPVQLVSSLEDSVIQIEDYHPEVRSLYQVRKPTGYLVPVSLAETTEWLKWFKAVTKPFNSRKKYLIEQYFITAIDSIDFEGDQVADPAYEVRPFQQPVDPGSYFFIPVDQLKGNLLMQALEPKSMMGLATYPRFRHLLRAGEPYPVLRVVEKNQLNDRSINPE
jgi:hypothetical protein